MTIQQFVRQNKRALTKYVVEQGVGLTRALTVRELSLLVLNNDHLYKWAQKSGVPI